MATSVLFQEQVEIPLTVHTLADFRGWALGEGFPEKGRIDFVHGRIEVDMSPEDVFCHGTLKSEIAGVLHQRVKQGRLGHLLIDSTRVSCPKAELSVEPDIVFVAHSALASGQARLIPKSTGQPGRYVEIEGAPDLVVEIVSDTSVAKDTQQLPAAYFQAGVREFWLADARGREPGLLIHHRGAAAYVSAERDAEGFQRSEVIGCRFRLEAAWEPQGHWSFDLRVER